MHLKRTTISKLLAAKRPALIPIWDTKVAGARFEGDRDVNDWQLWRERCASPAGDELRLVVSLANNSRFELLRAKDVAIWMRVWGDPSLAALRGPGDREPVIHDNEPTGGRPVDVTATARLFGVELHRPADVWRSQ